MGRQYLQRHCRNGAWLTQRLADTSAIEIAFLGSSHTMCAVSDALLETLLDEAGGGPQVANLGLCRLGRTMTWALTRRLMARSQPPRWLIVEVRVTEDRFSHPDYPYLASGADLLGAYPFWHQRYLEQLGQGLLARFQDARYALLGLPLPEAPPYVGRHGFVLGGERLYISPEQVPNRPLLRRPAEGWEAWTYAESLRFPMHYLERAVQAAQAQGTRVAFLYLPAMGRPAAQRPLELARYQAWGPVWEPPADILDPVEHWMDPAHLNEIGAEALTRWLAGQIRLAEAEEIEEQKR